MTDADTGRPRRARLAALALAAVTVAVALAPRLWRIDAHLTPDELRWVCRSLGFHTGLRTGDLALTLQTGHPGVVTMWLGGLGLPVEPEAAWSQACLGSRSSELLYELDPADRRVILDRLYAGRRRIAVFTALLAGAIVWLAGRLLGRRVAGIAAPLVALDPFWLAHGRFLHLDGVLTGLVTVTLLALLLHLVGPDDAVGQGDAAGRGAAFGPARGRPWLVASGVGLGLSLAAKSPALFVVGFGGLLWLATARRRRVGLRAMAGEGALWLAVAAATLVVVWPALWASPLAVGRLYLGEFASHGTATLERASFFAGEVRDDAGPAFYWIVWWLRTSPWVLVGVPLAAAGWVVGRRRGGRSGGVEVEVEGDVEVAADVDADGAGNPAGDRRAVVVGALLGFVVLFTLFLSAASKEFDRYLLPAFPAADIAAAAGWVTAMGWLGRWAGRWRQGGWWRGGWARHAVPLPVAIVWATQLGVVLPIGPYWVTWYDPLAGGAERAQRLMLVGWGEGLDQAAAWLNAQPGAAELEVASRYRAAFGLLFDGRNVQTERYDPDTTDYLVVMLNQVQRHQDAELLATFMGVDPPAFAAEIGGITLAWVYRNRADEPVQAFLAEHGDPTRDALALRGGHILMRRYDGPLVRIGFTDTMDADAVARRLRLAFARAERLWFVHRAEGERAPVDRWLATLLATGARRFDTARLGDLVVEGYTDADPRAFAPPPPLPLAVDLGPAGALGLRALGLPPGPWPNDRQAGLTIRWQSPTPLDPPPTLSVQLLDATGAPRAHLDVPLAAGGGSRDGDVDDGDGDATAGAAVAAGAPSPVTDRHALDVVGLPPGDYTLSIGAYTTLDGDWTDLPVAAGADLAALEAAGLAARVEGNRVRVAVRVVGGKR